MYVQVCLGGLISVCFAYTYQDREITGEVKQVYPSIFAGGAFAARAGPTPRTRIRVDILRHRQQPYLLRGSQHPSVGHAKLQCQVKLFNVNWASPLPFPHTRKQVEY